MELFLSAKLVAARAMTLGDYNTYRGWTIPDNEDPAAEGFLVEYLDGLGKANHPDHKNYISWAPKAAFDAGNIRVGDESTLDLPAFHQRLLAELAQEEDRLAKLQTFQGTEAWNNLPDEARRLLVEQDSAKGRVIDILKQRLALIQPAA